MKASGEDYSSAFGVFYTHDVGILEIRNFSTLTFSDDRYADGGVIKANADTSMIDIADSTLTFKNAVRGFSNGTITLTRCTATGLTAASSAPSARLLLWLRKPLLLRRTI